MKTRNHQLWRTLSEELRERREQLGLSTAAVARRCGYSCAEYLELFEFRKRTPPLNDLPRLARALEVDVVEFCRRWIEYTDPELHDALFPEHRKD